MMDALPIAVRSAASPAPAAPAGAAVPQGSPKRSFEALLEEKRIGFKSADAKRPETGPPPRAPSRAAPGSPAAPEPLPLARPDTLSRRAATRALGTTEPLPLPPPAPPPVAPPATRGAPATATLRDRLAEAEGTADEPCQGYAVRNPRSGALGRYQMLPIALRDIGWMDAGGGWTQRAAAAGVRSTADFLARPAAQEAAMADYLHRAEQQLSANGALGQAGRRLRGLDGQPILLTRTGLVAAAHRQGAGAVAKWLEHRMEQPAAPLSPAERSRFQSIETRLRNFASLPAPERSA
ncbi:hypothetical protein [Pseudoroseomonas cervicalis]|uniref:hypothetical protein n=1 Tax=Teichococcus cervicalis TaxID=204525 RepID=UPI0022F19679|nr:hypothetical protein [Pseudoroseomonas cervicalis]WBV43660.1 hypothetical protein PFY06_03605 [Pseudoroseomonas cervicalis]